MPKNTINSLPTPATKVHFHRLILGGLVALLPALMAAKGCDVAQIGSDERACGGLEGLSCDSGEFCKYSQNDSCSPGDETGVCEPVPELCGEIYAPVCGCDDKTYDNECSANAAGVSVASNGECGDPSNVCGPMEDECDEGEFCKYPISASCGADTEAGVCTPKPETCTLEDMPVCGCDGETYSNPCEANAEGVSVASAGECGDPSKVCSLMGEECGEGEFCNYPADAFCGKSEGTGVCEPVPEACDGNYDPVCGCDGDTYSNACAANTEGVSVLGEGECVAAVIECGGSLGEECGEGEFCKYPPNPSCASADERGWCEPVPEVCGEIYAPVCGCDGETYDNECLADAAGAFIAFVGDCDQTACGAMTGETCGEGEFCNYPISSICGLHDVPGVCTPTPETCTLEDTPVCGCDGETYDNTCYANSAGVAVLSEGACGAVCGGSEGDTCGESEFCNTSVDASCAADAAGTCEPMPDGCDDYYDPVCGCDGTTHSNVCTAHMAGTSVAYAGECFDEPKACGGLVGGLCDEGEFCYLAPERACGGTDEAGVCEPIPEGCTTDYDPVCGCDGETYGNECEARAAAVSIQALGECNE